MTQWHRDSYRIAILCLVMWGQSRDNTVEIKYRTSSAYKFQFKTSADIVVKDMASKDMGF